MEYYTPSLLNKEHRVIQNDNGHCMVQVKGWFFWRNVKQVCSSWDGTYTQRYWFNNLEQACKWIQLKLKNEQWDYENNKRASKWNIVKCTKSLDKSY